MGQYFHAVILDAEASIMAWLSPFNSGMKLMEHSYLGDEFVSTFEWELSPAGRFHKSCVVWAGDYADNEPNATENLYTISKSCKGIEIGAGEDIKSTINYPFLVNHTTRQFVNKLKVPKDRNGFQIHPLPLLTCEGNGRGGGDFYGESTIIGSWARDVISVEKTAPDGFTEFVFDLVENN
jgi:hypothetical protein